MRRYLDYTWEIKKQIKIEEEEVKKQLNKELWDKITIYLNGKLLYSIEVFQNFKIDFLSEVAFIFRKKSFSLDDTILFENEMGNEVFFISSGTVAIIHK